MNKTAASNRDAIFGADATCSQRNCRIIGRTKRPIAGRIHLGDCQPCDLWVWTNQRGRVAQDVHCRINLRDKDALAQLAAAGVVL